MYEGVALQRKKIIISCNTFQKKIYIYSRYILSHHRVQQEESEQERCEYATVLYFHLPRLTKGSATTSLFGRSTVLQFERGE